MTVGYEEAGQGSLPVPLFCITPNRNSMTPDTSPFERQLIEACLRGSGKHQEKLYKLFFGLR